MAEVDPMIVEFYTNPGPFEARASLALNTRPARLASRLATLLLGQGLYECNLDQIESRFRVFRRADGSMHFLRELYCAGRLRVFDSDFVVRETARGPALFEVFADLGSTSSWTSSRCREGACRSASGRSTPAACPCPRSGCGSSSGAKSSGRRGTRQPFRSTGRWRWGHGRPGDGSWPTACCDGPGGWGASTTRPDGLAN